MFLVEKNISLPEWQALLNMLERALILLQAHVIMVYYVGHINSFFCSWRAMMNHLALSTSASFVLILF